MQNPEPFFNHAQELYPSGKYRPNTAHYFVRLLQDKGLLLRMFTQNVDGLERCEYCYVLMNLAPSLYSGFQSRLSYDMPDREDGDLAIILVKHLPEFWGYFRFIVNSWSFVDLLT